MKFPIKSLRIISMLLIVIMLIPSNLVYSKTKNSNVEDLDRLFADGMYKDSSNLKVGKTNIYRFKIRNKSQILILFQAEDESAYSINVYNSKGKKVASNKKCKKTWRKVIAIPSGTHKIEIKALKESAYTLNVKYKGAFSFRTKPNGKEKGFIEYDMGEICGLDGTLIKPIVSGGKWVVLEPHTYKRKEKSTLAGLPDFYYDDTYYKIKTISKSKIYKVDENSPKGNYIYYLKDNCLYKYFLESTDMYNKLCDEIYNHELSRGSGDRSKNVYLSIDCINRSEKTLKKIIFDYADSEEEYENGLTKKISIPIVVFGNKNCHKYVDVTNKVQSEGIYVNSIKFVYMDNTTKVYQVNYGIPVVDPMTYE